MRMWMVDPELMCRQHLLGEHFELHLFVSAIRAHKKLDGFKKGLLEVHSLRIRHAQLVVEMKSRGYQHKSPLENFKMERAGWVDRKESLRELARRCKTCKQLQKREGGSVNCERCGRHVEKVREVRLSFPEREGIRSSLWHQDLFYKLCVDCGHEMRRKLVDTAIRVIGMYSTKRSRGELA